MSVGQGGGGGGLGSGGVGSQPGKGNELDLRSLSFGSGEAAADVSVLAASACNGLAPTAYETWAFRRAEMGAFIESPFRCENGEKATMARIQTLPQTLHGAARLAALAPSLLAPLADVLAALPAKTRIGFGLALSSRFGRAAGPRGRAQQGTVVRPFQTALEARSLNVSVFTEERDHAGFGSILLSVATALDRGVVDLAIVGGLDSYFDPTAIQALIDERRLFDGEQLDSLIPGEGGALLVLARRDVAHQLGLKAVGELRAVAVAQEPAWPDDDEPSTAQGLTAAASACAAWLGRRRLPLGWWLSDMTGEEFRMNEFQLLWPRMSGLLDLGTTELDFLGSHLGDLGAATLPTALAIGLEGMRRGAPAAQHMMCTASGVLPDRACVLLEGVPSRG